ncbi:hypothetical protein B0H12DRAFT_1076986 [Mycena haematopus]|nr:hypothetical protein B0H12DRAFT_1076986 [Mycena haematopus]
MPLFWLEQQPTRSSYLGPVSIALRLVFKLPSSVTAAKAISEVSFRLKASRTRTAVFLSSPVCLTSSSSAQGLQTRPSYFKADWLVARVGGISFAISLQRRLGPVDFTIYDKGSDVGGTWRGAASDTFVHFYSLSTDLNPGWSSTLGSQSEMCAYWRKLARKYDLYRHIQFNHLVISAEWNAKEQLYHIVTRNALGNRIHDDCQDSDLRQLESLKLHDFQIFLEFLCSKEIDFTRHSGILNSSYVENGLLSRNLQNTELVLSSRNIDLKSQFGFFLGVLKKYISMTAPRRMPAAFPLKDIGFTFFAGPGCKRMLQDSNYLAALHRPNLSLNWDGIESVFEHGIITQKGVKLEFDAMIFATGFVAPQLVRSSVRINSHPNQRVGGETIQQYYDSQRGPKAYMGMTVPGFPNLFMIGGPNTTTGHTSVLLFEELQARGSLLLHCTTNNQGPDLDWLYPQFVKPILDGVVTTFEVSSEATDRYNNWIQSRLSRSVHMSCASWYRVAGTGKSQASFPVQAVISGGVLANRSGATTRLQGNQNGTPCSAR